MACFHPNHVVSRVVDGLIETRFLGSAAYLKSEDLYRNNPADFHSLVPCGHCMGCRLDRARTWADRMLIELADNDYKAVFATLTYDNDHLPRLKSGCFQLPDDEGVTFLSEDKVWLLDAMDLPKPPATLSVRDTQLFFKRLRKAFPGRKIRYFLSGEYGPKTNRPHYHAIIYGLTLADLGDCVIHKFNDLGHALYRSQKFADIWSNGHCLLSPVNWNTCSYVARYTMKKKYKSDDEHAYDDGRLPPFCTMSRRPGIGLSKASELLSRGDKAFVRDENGVHEVYLGRPFIRSALRPHIQAVMDASPEDLQGVIDVEFPSVKALRDRQDERAFNSVQRSISLLAATDKSVLDYYLAKEVYFKQRLKLLPERGDLFEYAETS